jgi:hypothetical protein
VIFLANPSTPAIRLEMAAGRLGCMTSPAQGNVLPDDVIWAAENGRFGSGWPGAGRWHDWLVRQAERNTGRCLFAVAPDVPFDAAGTLAESLPWLPRIRDLGLPAAFAAQDGCDLAGLPWAELDVLFLAGSTEWKIGPVAEQLARQATARGVPVHMGRVNSWRRLLVAEWFGCSSADGTYLRYGPDVNLPRLLGWSARLEAQPSLMGAAAGR